MRYFTHAHAQNKWQQTNSSTLQKQNNPEQSLIEILSTFILQPEIGGQEMRHRNYIKQPEIC